MCLLSSVFETHVLAEEKRMGNRRRSQKEKGKDLEKAVEVVLGKERLAVVQVVDGASRDHQYR